MKGLPTGTFLLAQSKFRCRNVWKYRIRCRFISYTFRCRKFPAARCRLSPFRSPRIAVSRSCRLSEFTPYRALLKNRNLPQAAKHFRDGTVNFHVHDTSRSQRNASILLALKVMRCSLLRGTRHGSSEWWLLFSFSFLLSDNIVFVISVQWYTDVMFQTFWPSTVNEQ